MAFDYKKEYKEFYLPSRKPHLITVPPMNFVTVQGKGDPNNPTGEYQAAMEVLYGLAYTIKMSYKGSHRMEGFFEYVVPPREEFDWAVQEATAKKKRDFSTAEFRNYDEGLCVQCMHVGSYDAEPETLEQMDAFAREQGYETDFTGHRRHHEIYLSDPRRTAPEKLKTVLRHPVRAK